MNFSREVFLEIKLEEISENLAKLCDELLVFLKVSLLRFLLTLERFALLK